MLKPTSRSALCAFCGDPATTKDHVPPKNIFLKPRPSDLITVDACGKCNQGASGDDDKFRTFISLSVGAGSPKTLALWQKGAFPSVIHNKRELFRIARSMERAPVHSKGGIYLGTATQATFEAGPHDRTIEKITRGLYCHEFSERLPKECPVEVVMVNSRDPTWGPSIRPTLQLMQIRSVGGSDVFEYAFARAPEQPQSSLWLFRFYAGHVAVASTGRIAYAEVEPPSITNDTPP